MTHQREGDTAWALVMLVVAMGAGAIIALSINKAILPTYGGEQSTQATPTSGGCAAAYYLSDPAPIAEAMLTRDGGQAVATMQATWYNVEGRLHLLAMNGESAPENLWSWAVCHNTETSAAFTLEIRDGEVLE